MIQLKRSNSHQFDISTSLGADHLLGLLPNYIPDYCLQGGDKSVERWVTLVLNSFKKSYHYKDKVPDKRVKEDIVSYAKLKWSLLCSRFYEAYRSSGPSLPKNDVIIAVNWTGVYVVDDQEQVLLELYVVAIQDYKPLEGSTAASVPLTKGDLIALEDNVTEGRISNRRGLTKPPPDVLILFSKDSTVQNKRLQVNNEINSITYPRYSSYSGGLQFGLFPSTTQSFDFK
ncbi:hypothetical protein CHUAL_013433 [Chamberlinius hualienensis]